MVEVPSRPKSTPDVSEVASTCDGLPATTFIYMSSMSPYVSRLYEHRDVLDTRHGLQEQNVVETQSVRPDAEAATTDREEANSDQTPPGARSWTATERRRVYLSLIPTAVSTWWWRKKTCLAYCS